MKKIIENSILQRCLNGKCGLYGCVSLVHTSDISIRTWSKRKQGVISPQELVKIKQEFSFVSSCVRLLAYSWTMILCLRLRRSLCRRLDFIPLFCFLFFFMLMHMTYMHRLWHYHFPVSCATFCEQKYFGSRDDFKIIFRSNLGSKASWPRWQIFRAWHCLK